MASGAVILVGGANDSHFPALSSNELAGSKVAHIGTHTFSSSVKKDIISFAKYASSTSEIMAGLIKELNGEINKDMASNLLSGMHEGSKSFSHSQVNQNTFKLASELMEAGGTYSSREERANTQKPVSSKPLPVKQEFESKEELLAKEGEETPKSWLEPKIYKGTSVS